MHHVANFKEKTLFFQKIISQQISNILLQNRNVIMQN